MSDLPKMLSKREIELEELEEAKYVQSLRDENQKLQERCDRYEKALTEIADVKRRLEQTTDFGVGFQTINNALAFAVVESEKALAAIGGDDE
ncbi:hypothetical protein [Lactococcus lactis]|uniref:hypothetical protein n=1 Tax=Lactococcus lactis TaxID=1358 RepID=UPI0032E3D926